jgi:hypothetical protein
MSIAANDGYSVVIRNPAAPPALFPPTPLGPPVVPSTSTANRVFMCGHNFWGQVHPNYSFNQYNYPSQSIFFPAPHPSSGANQVSLSSSGLNGGTYAVFVRSGTTLHNSCHYARGTKFQSRRWIGNVHWRKFAIRRMRRWRHHVVQHDSARTSIVQGRVLQRVGLHRVGYCWQHLGLGCGPHHLGLLSTTRMNC